MLCLLAAALSLQLLQQRTLLGVIESAENNVDLGALLARMSGSFTSEPLKSAVSAAVTAYRATVVTFKHDGILPDVSQ